MVAACKTECAISQPFEPEFGHKIHNSIGNKQQAAPILASRFCSFYKTANSNMSELFTRAKEKLGTVSSAVLHLPSQNSVDTLRNEVTQTTAQITHLLNPSPLAHAMSDTADAVDEFVGRNLGVNPVNKVVEWHVRHAKLCLCSAKEMMSKMGDLDKAILSVKDEYLTRFMEAKGSLIPEPIERIFC